MRSYVRVDAATQLVEPAEVEVPSLGAAEVLIAVEAFGVGIHDRYFIPVDGPFPYVIGTEGAGVVIELGPDVRGIAVGDRVMASTSLHAEGGTWAEVAVIPETGITAMPDAMDFSIAAGIPIAGKTAVESLHTLAMASGETLYVAGASGAIGTLVVQMAVQRGVRVVGSASEPNHPYLLDLGAELAVDYRDPNWTDEVHRWAPGGVDAALAIQPGTAAPAQRRARPWSRRHGLRRSLCVGARHQGGAIRPSQ